MACTVAGGLGGGSPSAQVAVPPKIMTPSGTTFWYFGGENPAGWLTSLPLTSSAGAGTSWSVTQGANKVNSSANAGAAISVSSSATISSGSTAFSTGVGDIKITATANGVPSVPVSLTLRAPHKLVHTGTMTNCGVVEGAITWTYHTAVNYDIKDTLGDPLPATPTKKIGINEQFGIKYDDIANDWGRQEAGVLLPSSDFFDKIAVAGPRTPPATCGGTGVAVDHWAQLWRIGSATVGAGRRVQSNTLQRYTNSGSHTAPITSPSLP